MQSNIYLYCVNSKTNIEDKQIQCSKLVKGKNLESRLASLDIENALSVSDDIKFIITLLIYWGASPEPEVVSASPELQEPEVLSMSPKLEAVCNANNNRNYDINY